MIRTRLTDAFNHEPSNEELVDFFRAAAGNDVPAAEKFLAVYESSVDAPHYYNSFISRTALSWAAQAGHAEMVALLLRHGADPNAEDSVGAHVLSYPARSGKVEIVRQLLDHGAFAFGGTEDHPRGALASAAAAGHNDIVELLLENGAPLEPRALQAAAWGDHLATARLLIARGTPATQEALHSAAYQGNADLLRLLMENGAEADAQSLTNAAAGGKLEAAALLLSEGAPPNTPASNDRTALMSAVVSGNADLVTLLLRSGASIDAATTRGDTALMTAATAGQPGMVRLLLEAGADPSLRNAQGETALEITRGHLKIFPDSELLKSNALLLEASAPRLPKARRHRPRPRGKDPSLRSG